MPKLVSPWLKSVFVRSILNCIATSDPVGVEGRFVKVNLAPVPVKIEGEAELMATFA